MEENQGVQEVEPTTQSDTPTDETNPAEETQPAVAEAEGSDEPTAETTPEADSTDGAERPSRLERRFSKMSQKIRSLAEENQNLQGQQYGQPASQAPPYAPPYQPGQEVTYDQYQTDMVNTVAAIAQLEAQKLRQEFVAKERAENFDRDVMSIEQRYPQLNEDSPEYDPKLSEKIATMYEKLATKSPDIRLREIADDIMDVAARQSAKSTAKVTKKIAQQAAETAIQPDTGNKPVQKTAKEKSLDELEAELGFA